ncbi:MAG: AMP-binding protein [Sandaracinaceae bacterium]
MGRTHDDHVRAVNLAIDRVREVTGQDVHLAGYSQGGIFCYQAAAFRRSEGVASIITFGSPVDIHRNIPLPLGDRLTDAVLDGLRRLLEAPIQKAEGIPGILTSIGFKLVSPRQEVTQLVDFLRKLHDRPALEKRETRRRFLAGEGFVAWPGPALRTFIDEFIVANRLASGGFVIDGRTVSLADVTCPILLFVGANDEIARPASVRAIRDVAYRAPIHEVVVRSGHLGLVVGSRALERSWPSVVKWLRWQAGETGMPEILTDAGDGGSPPAEEGDLGVSDVVEVAQDALEDLWTRVGRWGEDLTQVVEALRWQLPRLARLRRIRAETRVSMGQMLAEQAERIPDATFFLWRGRAFSYADADRRVSNIVRGLLAQGIEPGDRVGVLMDPRPTYLSTVAALNRLGAVAVLLGPDSTRIRLERALRTGQVSALIADPVNAERARRAFGGEVLILGGPFGERRALPDGVTDLEAIDPDKVQVPAWYEPNPGRARDLALVIFTAGRGDEPRAARVTHRRWAFSAYGAAATATLDPTDTVYCVLPLHHAAGILVAVGGAMVGGARLALAPRFAPEHFWSEARRYGATVVFYAGELCRPLVDAAPDPGDQHHPVRLFAGSGMRADVWERLQHRFGVGVLEFYAATEGNAVLVNASGKKVGSLGQPLPGATDMSLVAYDVAAGAFVRDELGQIRRSGVDEPGLLIARVDAGHPLAGFDGYLDHGRDQERLIENVFERGDRWFVTGDLLRQDADGDYHFVDRLADVVLTREGPVFTRAVEDALYRLAEVKLVVVYGVGEPAEARVVASVVPRSADLDVDGFSARVAELLRAPQRPDVLRVVDTVPLTDGYRPLKRPLAERGIDLAEPGARWYRWAGDRYVPWTAEEPQSDGAGARP